MDSARAHDPIEPNLPLLQAEPESYSVLMSAIVQAASDPERLRKLIYVMALQNTKPGASPRDSVPDPVEEATTLLELEQALQFEHAICRTDRQAVQTGHILADEEPRILDHANLDEVADHRSALLRGALSAAAPAASIPTFLNAAARMPFDTPDYVRHARRQGPLRTGLLTVTQLALASIAGVALYAGMAGWMRLERPIATAATTIAPPIARTTPAARIAMVVVSRTETVGSAHTEPRHARSASDTFLPFPLPATHGVYAGGDGRLSALEPLAVDIPVAKFQMSAEVSQPGRTLVSGDNLKFIAFRPDAATPENASLHVVARVTHAITFANGNSVTTPIASAWRVRDKSYHVNVSALEGHPDMTLIEPDAGVVLPAGRYALVLEGKAYDFVVPGPVTASEQCLEQFQLQNGMALSECPKS